MKKILSTLALLFLAVGAQAQNAYPLFAPSNGIMKGDVNTFVTSSATGADVTSLFSGTCNAAAFLRGDASCFDLFGTANTWSQTQSFTSNGSNARFNGADPRFLINETDVALDSKNWLVRSVASAFDISTATDASPFSAVSSAFNIARTGTTIGQITLAAPSATVVMNGSGGVTGTVGNSGLTAISGITTTGQFLNNDSNPSYYINESDAGVDEKLWRLNGAVSHLVWSTRTDANAGGQTFFDVSRTGTAVQGIALTAPSLTLTGTTTLAGIVFSTGSRYELESTAPIWQSDETDAPADERSWLERSQGGNWFLSTASDASPQAAVNNAIQVQRTGTTVDSVDLTATTITLNGVAASDYARLSQSNTFTGNTQTISNTSGPRVVLRDSDAAADTQCFFMLSQSSQFDLYASTDANCNTTTGAENFFTATRTGAVINDVRFPNGNVRVNTADSPALVVSPTIANITSRSGGTSVIAASQVNGSAAAEASFSLTRANGANAAGPLMYLNKSRGSIGTPGTVVVSGDDLGKITFSGADGTNFSNGGELGFQVDGTPGANDMPGRFVVSVTADGASTPTEQFRIANNGAWGLTGANFGTTGQVLTSNGNTTAPTWQTVAAISPANPTASVGLSAVNGSAATYMRSDAAPALSQSITPTWTGTHIFSNALGIQATGAVGLEIENAGPTQQYDETDAAANERSWLARTSGGLYALSTATDAAPTTAVENVLTIDRAGTVSGRIVWQNTTDGLMDLRGTNTGNTNVSGYEMLNSAGTRTGFVGDGSSANADIFLQSDTTNSSIRLNSNGTGEVMANDLPILGRDAATSTNVVRIVSAQFKGGNTDRSSNTTLSADPTLAGLRIPETGSYIVEGHLCFVGPVSGAGGIKLRYEFSGSVSTSMGKYFGSVNAAVVASGNFVAIDANQITFATITTGSGGDCIEFDHTFVTTGTGTLDLQWAQSSSNANATRLLAGSSMKVTRIG